MIGESQDVLPVQSQSQTVQNYTEHRNVELNWKWRQAEFTIEEREVNGNSTGQDRTWESINYLQITDVQNNSRVMNRTRIKSPGWVCYKSWIVFHWSAIF